MIDEYANPLCLSKWDGAGRILADEGSQARPVDILRSHEPSMRDHPYTVSNDVIIS